MKHRRKELIKFRTSGLRLTVPPIFTKFDLSIVTGVLYLPYLCHQNSCVWPFDYLYIVCRVTGRRLILKQKVEGRNPQNKCMVDAEQNANAIAAFDINSVASTIKRVSKPSAWLGKRFDLLDGSSILLLPQNNWDQSKTFIGSEAFRLRYTHTYQRD